MNLQIYDEKHVQVQEKHGYTFTGVADYLFADYCFDEFGKEEDAIIINGYLIYESQIVSIEEIEVHGTVELRTERLILRRYTLEDVSSLYETFGTDPVMYQYSGWNPYASMEMTQETVQRFIESYSDDHVYSWIMDYEDVVIGTIGAYDYHDDQIEVGFSVARNWWGRGYATEALTKVLEYLTENEGISTVKAWCAAENIGSKRTLEKAGMTLVEMKKGGLVVGDLVYDQLFYEYHRHIES